MEIYLIGAGIVILLVVLTWAGLWAWWGRYRLLAIIFFVLDLILVFAVYVIYTITKQGGG